MKLWEYTGHFVRMIDIAGNIREGRAEYYFSAADNDHDEMRAVPSICVGDYYIFEDEIVSMEILKPRVAVAPVRVAHSHAEAAV
ncbi:MAG: hypothetical protein LBE35_06595 [Clostridiales bacterium]|jgi:hypothetical protein|nr:hypothetical protein [Clostridiales bacterium]